MPMNKPQAAELLGNSLHPQWGIQNPGLKSSHCKAFSFLSFFSWKKQHAVRYCQYQVFSLHLKTKQKMKSITLKENERKVEHPWSPLGTVLLLMEMSQSQVDRKSYFPNRKYRKILMSPVWKKGEQSGTAWCFCKSCQTLNPLVDISIM